jgi:hypothetical protein
MCVKIVYPKRRTWLERVSEQIAKENICTKKKKNKKQREAGGNSTVWGFKYI